MSEIMLGRQGDHTLNKHLVNDMFRLRHDVFHDRLRWDVGSESGMERDVFDDCNPVYVLARNASSVVEGCWRLLPTSGPYMLKDVFPQLLYGHSAPHDPRVWELSRFAVSAPQVGEAAYGFTDIPVRMMQRAVEFAKGTGIESYVTVTTVGVERLMRKLGLKIHRFGPPMRIGRVMTVACRIDIDGSTEAAVRRRPDFLFQEAA